jgi:hypothetical protein
MPPDRKKVDKALAEARTGNFTPMFGLSDADHEYILANGDHDRAMDVSRRRVRAMGWTEEEIRKYYPPCDCPRCTERRMARIDALTVSKALSVILHDGTTAEGTLWMHPSCSGRFEVEYKGMRKTESPH